MICPYCGKQLEAGVLNSKSPVLWSEGATGLPFPTQKGDVMLGNALGFLRPKCRNCRKVIVDY